MSHGALRLTCRALAAQWRRPVSHETRRWSSVTTRQWSTPLAKTIADAIEATGPISVAAYMRQVLTSDRGGYYTTTRTADQFGRAGDFITSPEISQIFGELCGIWLMTEWMGQGRRNSGVQLIEMGPGRGTLMSDMLRTIAQFKTFAQSIDAVWMIEASEGLRTKQKDLLCGKDVDMKRTSDGSGWECLSRSGIPVRWVEDIALLPKKETGQNITPFIIAHEFFDALPIHAFESVAPNPNTDQPANIETAPDQPVRKKTVATLTPQWRELLVGPTPFTPSLISTQAEIEKASAKKLQPDFQLTLAPASNPTSLILPAPPRYAALRSNPGSRIEISPESTRYVAELARRIGTSGAALIIDYGPASTIPIDSLRGIKGHAIVSPFATPGEADVSADVDFTALAHAALEASEDVEVYGPVEQGAWLEQLGIRERAEQLVRGMEEEGSDEKKKEFEAGWRILVEGGPRGMGKAYKVMSIVPGSGGKRRPVGFGGDVLAE